MDNQISTSSKRRNDAVASPVDTSESSGGGCDSDTPIITKEKNKIDETLRQVEEANRHMRALFSDFMTGVAKFEELVSVGSRLLVGFQQALGYLTRPPIDDKLLERIVNTASNNSSRRVLSYIEAGCVNEHDSVQNVSKLHTCHLGLQDHVRKAKSVADELGTILEDAAALIVDDVYRNIDSLTITSDAEEEVLPSKPEAADYATAMAVVYSMAKQDYTMQERIVSSLGLKSSPGELETYCQMWSLRPFVDDQIMQSAWNLVS